MNEYCVYCETPLANDTCGCDGETIEILSATVDDLLAALLQVEWVSTPYQMDEDTYYCPWCRGVRPNQWKANYKAQEMETCLGHAEDCPRQAAIAKARG